MQRAPAKFVTVEQLGVWIERREWFDQARATRMGFANATLNEIIEKHRSGAIQFSAIVDGERGQIDDQSIDDYVFETTWARRASLLMVGSGGNCEVRGRSIQVFLPEKLADHSRRSSELVHSPALPEGTVGYHRVVRNIRVNQHSAMRIWPHAASPADAFRDQIVDLLLLTAGTPNFPTNSVALFEIVRTGPLLSAVSNTDLEQFIAANFPRFSSALECRWAMSVDKAVKYSDDKLSETIAYSAHRNGRPHYDWVAIEDALLVRLLSQGLPRSHGSLARQLQDIVRNGKAGPGRTDTDKHFARYPGFFTATEGHTMRRVDRPKKADAKGMRRAANMRRG